ncbi:hypothetical protein EYF80_052941 [Liparis tanakae]|uniref:Uncharacterized protein n=1 Tax=Liparis tanakae TaxID=230148 RepID=A0A4Z2F7V4_9TELE|nr:hypothetical protein EYF80_052941 [Liparis tanakae]
MVTSGYQDTFSPALDRCSCQTLQHLFSDRSPVTPPAFWVTFTPAAVSRSFKQKVKAFGPRRSPGGALTEPLVLGRPATSSPGGRDSFFLLWSRARCQRLPPEPRWPPASAAVSASWPLGCIFILLGRSGVWSLSGS